MKNRNMFQKLGDFVLGKGFYIVLFLCVATIGISGYYLIRTMNHPGEAVEPTGGNASVVLPDSEANGPDPEGSLHTGQDITGGQSAQTVIPHTPEQPDDPASVKQTEAESGQAPKPIAVVFTWPVKGEILRDFSVETLSPDPTLGDWRTHGALDIAAAMGVEVLAMGAGTVTEVYEDGLMGTTVVIDHGNGLSTTYCNLAGQPTVEPGDTVETGTIIGAVGDTAIAESGLASHLHLEAWLNGELVDPVDYLPKT
ncbi:MAG: M23 family metallopeptidase [Lawsonibacter sp.]|nr:M23 family metallopeptidase [Lawsonibacter sp.]